MTSNLNDFRPARALANRHVQTIWGRLTRSPAQVPVCREILPTPDGDELIVDHFDVAVPTADDAAAVEAAVPTAVDARHLLLLHGLEGSSNSVYTQGMLSLLRARGTAATALNFRSCARVPGHSTRTIPNRGARLYHSGDTGDFDFVLSTLAARFPGRRFAAIGVSVGGNVLLKWLAEHPGDPRIVRAATLSVPFDLEACARHLESGIGRFYTAIFLKALKAKAREVAARSAEAARRFDLARGLKARTFFEFDDLVTAPLHGFAGAHDYYSRSSSLPGLDRIATPTLMINALDDPFVPESVSERVRSVVAGLRDSPLRLVLTRGGGHAGFVGGSLFRPRFWAEERLVEWVLEPSRRAMAPSG